jgi:general secretion pathway protein K
MKARGAQGYALIVALWLVTLLTILTMGYHAAAHAESKALAQSVRGAQADALAEAGIWLALGAHLRSDSPGARRSPRIERTFELGDATIRTSLADASGWINLNTARPELLDAALAHAVTDASARDALVQSIVDWRDEDHEKSPHGAEDNDYARMSYSYGAKDAPFATVDELRRVAGMTDEVFRRIAPLLTVQGNHARINPEAAPTEVLAALPGADEAAIADFVRRRADNATGGATARNAGTLDNRFTQSGGSDVYVVSATAESGGAKSTLTATVRYARGEREPVQVLAWESRGD